MGSRIIEWGVALAAVLSAVLLGFMLATPWLPQPSAVAPPASSEPAPSASAAPEAGQPPMGIYRLRTPFSFGPCLAIELEPRSYPVAEGAEGQARVYWWVRGMTGCDSRTGEVQTVTAQTHVVPHPSDPEAEPLGYTLEFALPVVDFTGTPDPAQTVRASLTILARQSTETVLQAVEDTPGSGQGYVLDRVPAVEPADNPLPSASPTAVVPPNGLFLLQGPLETDGPCLVVELGEPSYPDNPSAEGTAGIRSWQPAVPDPSDPAQCLMRRGDIHEADATVTAARDSSGIPIEFRLVFSVPVDGSDATRTIELSFEAAQRSRDVLEATFIEPDAGIRVFDRVDAIDPPLAPGP